MSVHLKTEKAGNEPQLRQESVIRYNLKSVSVTGTQLLCQAVRHPQVLGWRPGHINAQYSHSHSHRRQGTGYRVGASVLGSALALSGSVSFLQSPLSLQTTRPCPRSLSGAKSKIHALNGQSIFH